MKKNTIILNILSLILFIIALSCGNKNSNTKGDKTNSAPIANAGADKTIIVNRIVILDGSKSSDPDGDALTYKWLLSVPQQSQAVLSDSTLIKPEFTPDIEGIYIATLIVNDGSINSNPDSITVSATTISFSKDVQPIFNNNCTGCHSQGSSASFLKLTI
ncbi:MAG: hypothetical protein HY934_10495 [Candidatus Firestonebacteria bacterium]|nr:hypothetical protein [Candidatus Firestonebacteria bacterium]